MLKVELRSQSGCITVKHALSFVYGNTKSKIIYPDHGPMTKALSTGKIHILYLNDNVKSILTFFHTESVLSFKDNIISFYSARIIQSKSEMSYKIQDSLNNDSWDKLNKNRLTEFDRTDWVIDHPEWLKD